MAETLRPDSIGPGHNNATPEALDSEQFLEFLGDHEECESEIAVAMEACKAPRKALKDLRKRIKDSGIDLVAFDRAREDREKPSIQREREDAHYRQLMGFLRKPVGTQAALDPAVVEFSEAELKIVDREGLEAGQAGDNVDICSYTPGSEAFARWQTAWGEGQKLAVERQMGDDNVTPIKRGRGRPRTNGQAEPTPPTA